MYEYEYVIKNQFETYPSNYSFKTIRCKREDTRGVNGTFSLSRKNKAFCSQLGNPNAGPLGPSVYSRGMDRILIQPLSRKETFPGSNVCTGQSSDARRDCLNDKEGSHCRALKDRSPGGFYSNMFLVPKKDGKMRPVINLKHLNQFVQYHHFKMEGMHTVRDLVQPNDWMTKIDLKDAYFTIPIKEKHQKFLRFTIEDRSFQFTCLPFGLSSAPWVFTKTLKPVATILRELVVRLVIYLDDILLMANSSQRARDHTSALIYLLQNLGFIVHPEKSITQPAQRVEFLGMTIDTTSMELQVPGEKIKKIRAEVRSLRDTPNLSARILSRLIGKMTSVAQAILPAPLFYRSLQRDLSLALERGNQQYDVPCHLTQGSKEELEWWLNHLQQWNGKNLIIPQQNISIESDASLIGWGATSNNVQTGAPWSPKEQGWHINCLEIQAANLAVRTFAKDKSNILILLLVDNTTAVSYINHLGGTVSPLATKLVKTCGHGVWNKISC